MHARVCIAISVALSASCTGRALDDAGGGGSEGESEATSVAGETGMTGTTGTSGTTSASTTTTSTTAMPTPKYDLGGDPKLDVAGPGVPPFSCEPAPPERALDSCAWFEAPWGFALVQCSEPGAGGICPPADDPEVASWFEVCGQCGGQLVDGPCGPAISPGGACCYWGSFEDGYCPTG